MVLIGYSQEQHHYLIDFDDWWGMLILHMLVPLNKHHVIHQGITTSQPHMLKRSAHENHSNFLRFLGHRPQPRVILILSIGLESNSQKTPCPNLKRFSRSIRDLNGVFCILLSRPFDKIKMILGQGQWPRVTGRPRVNQCAFLLEKSVDKPTAGQNTLYHL